ncbi:hypothetical protein BGW41_004980 [Actinomortierella wolfii]|nr:hypothetical protein BGW41_004980 [Actinomortierella wolfii]
MFARMSLSQAARLCSQQTRNFASSAARRTSQAHSFSHYPRHPLVNNVSPQFFTANKFQPGRFNNILEAQQNAIRARYQLRAFHAERKQWQQQQHPAFTSPFFNTSARTASSTSKSATSAAASATRGFCGGRSRYDPSWQQHMDVWKKWHKHHMRWYHGHHHYAHRPRRFFRGLFRAIVWSTAIIAIPAVIVFGASTALPILFVPIAVGGALFFAGGMVFFILPVVLVGGAIAFFTFSMPAAIALKDVGKIFKRDKKNGEFTSALGVLGKDWEIQPAGKDEYFHWTFPTNRQPLDKVEVRVAVFDPEDDSRRKRKTLKWFDRFIDEINNDNRRSGDSDNDGEDGYTSKRASRKSNFEYRNSKWDDDFGPKDLTLRRDGNHIEIKFEDDGEKIMKSKFGKKYLKLGQIVDRAASEIEAREGRKLGDQVVLVRKGRRDSCCWWTPYGDVALRIPFSRQWVHDLSDE